VRFYYDCEFLEDGRTIDLISIGIVNDRGDQYYAVDLDAPWRRIRKHPWLVENVLPSLPHTPDGQLDEFNPVFRERHIIAEQVHQFLTGPGEPVELWAWYGAYDHVALCQLYGTMNDHPNGIPMWTNDLQQEAHRLGVDPEQILPPAKDQHNALADAEWNWRLHVNLQAIATVQNARGGF